MKIVFLGDSLTYGYGVSRKDAWLSLVPNMTGYTIVNKGISGDTTGGMLSRFIPDVVSEKPDIVHIMGGGNDFICDLDLNSVKSNVMAMVHQALSYGIKPILGTIPEVKTGKLNNAWSGFADFDKLKKVNSEYNDWIVKFSKYFKTDLIDYAKKLPEYYAKEDVSEIYLDGIHYNEEGNLIMAKIFTDSIRELV